MRATQAESEYAIETQDLGKRYRSFWALQNCNITIPRGSITALVGPNGAGKTTLLKLLAGLNRPSAGSMVIFDHKPAQTEEYLSNIGYVAQEVPLYNRFSARDHFSIGKHTDLRWDNELAVERLQELHIPLDQPVSKLSGGQRAQVGLAMALAKQPRLLLLDEPVAALDPLARSDFLASLTQAVANANGELTVVMSSHMLADLERVCDHLVILATGETQLCDNIEQVIETHKLLSGPLSALPKSSDYTIIREVRSSTSAHILVRTIKPVSQIPHWHVQNVDIEEIVLAYMGRDRDSVEVIGDAK